MWLIPLILLTVTVSLSSLPVSSAAQSGSAQDRMRSELDVPVPGTVSDQETTHKQRDPAKDQGSDQNAQVTLGGAKSVVTGHILKIEGHQYFVKDDASGDEVRLTVNKDTNMHCGSTKGQVSSERQSPAPGASERQQAQGQKPDETAVGSGFKIGDCAFQAGNKVKAEVSDMGTVTTLTLVSHDKDAGTPTAGGRKVGESAGTGELAIPSGQDKPGQLNMTGPGGLYGTYVLLPVPLGGLEAAAARPLPVKNPDGKILGTLEKLIMDSSNGQVQYAVVRLAETGTLEPVPWADFTISRDKRVLIVTTKQNQLTSALSAREAKDRSPAIAKIVQDMQNLRSSEEKRGKERKRAVK